MSTTPSPTASRPNGNDWLTVAVRTAHVAVVVSELATGTIIEVNAAFTRIFGYARDEAIGRSGPELGLWPDIEERERLIRWLEQGGSVTGFECRFRNKAGELGFLSISARIVRIGTSDLIIAFLTDATEKRRLEDGLRVAQDRLRVIFAATQILAFHQDRDLRYTWIANPALGVTADDILGRTEEDMLGPEEAAPLIAIKRRVMETGQATRQEVFVSRAGQSGWYDLIVEPDRDASGAVVGVLCAATDITARKARQAGAPQPLPSAESDLEEPARSTQRLRLWAESFARAGFGLAISDALTDRFVAVNPAFAQERGYTEAELVGQPVSTIVPEPARAQRLQRMKQLEASLHVAFETEHQHKDGHLFPVLMDLTLVRSADGTPLNRVAYALDISERKEQERRIAALHAALEQRAVDAESAARAKTAFVANVSHEIRTPLNAITGMTALIRREGVTETQRIRLDKVEAATAQLLGIVDDLLDLSQIESGRVALESVPLQLSEVVAGAVAMLTARAAAKNLVIETDVQAGPFLLGDAKRLRHALVNYLANAVKFTDSGRIVVRAREIEPRPGDVLVQFDVTDTGVGIPADVLLRLFTPFEQADNSASRRFGGTGLGLAITRRLAQLMGGDAGAESKVGVGSTFWFTARLARHEGEATVAGGRTVEDLEAELRSRFAGRRVLVVEDDPVNRLFACDLLRLAGLRVEEAIDGAQAIEMVRAQRYALVLMDLQMPVVDGLEATRQIRALPNGGHVPVVAVSANANAEDRELCLAAGMDDFIAKPVDPAMLYPRLLYWLAR